MQFIDRFDGKALLNAGLILSFMTFVAISLAESFIHLIPAQMLLGTSWSCLYVGSLVYLMSHNVENSTSSGILGSLISLSMVLGSLLGGALWGLFGYRATMYRGMLNCSRLLRFQTFEGAEERKAWVETRAHFPFSSARLLFSLTSLWVWCSRIIHSMGKPILYRVFLDALDCPVAPSSHGTTHIPF